MAGACSYPDRDPTVWFESDLMIIGFSDLYFLFTFLGGGSEFGILLVVQVIVV